MPASVFETLMRHHAWAAERLLDAAALLTPEQLEVDALSQGSVLATLRHIADVDQSWGRTARGVPGIDVKEVEAVPDLESLRAFWLAEGQSLVEFARSLSPADLDREVRPEWKTQPYRIWQILLHVSNHGAEHGNEIGWRLTRMGHSPGEMGFMRFVDATRALP